MTLEHEQPADVRDRQAGEPAVLGARVDGRPRRRAPRPPPRARAARRDGHDRTSPRWRRPARSRDRSAHPRRAGRRPRRRSRVGCAVAISAARSAPDRRTSIGRIAAPASRACAEHRQPSGPRRQRDCDQVAGAQRAPELGRPHAASVPRGPPGPCRATIETRSIRVQREVHAIVEWVAAGEWEDIRYETAGGIAKLTINRPEVRNAFRPTTLFELDSRLRDGARRPGRSASSCSPAREPRRSARAATSASAATTATAMPPGSGASTCSTCRCRSAACPNRSSPWSPATRSAADTSSTWSAT